MANGYESARRQAMERFLQFDQQEMLARLPLRADGEHIYLSFLGRPYALERRSGLLRRLWDGAEAGFDEQLSVCDYLCESRRGCRPSGEFVNSSSLQAVVTSRIGETGFRPYEAAFTARPEAAARAMEGLGGRRAGKGDLAYEFPVFPDGLSLRLGFWLGDEDFPSSLQLLWDRNVLAYIRFETTYYVSGFLLDEIIKEMRE